MAIVVDSAASLPEDLTRRPQLYVVPMRLVVDQRTYLDGRNLTPTDFYRMLRESPTLPSTSAPSPAGFLEAFSQAAEGSQTILCLTVASRFSSSFHSAIAATRGATELLPGVRVSVLDTKNAAGAEGLIALEAWRNANRGGGPEQVAAAAQGVMSQIRLLAFLDTLYYLWKGGRVPGIAYAGTSLLRIKPLFEVSQGEIRTVARPRTTRRATNRLLELMHERVTGPGRIHATVMHADALDAAEELRERVKAEFPCDELFISEFSPVMGAHVGPGLLGIAFWCQRSQGG